MKRMQKYLPWLFCFTCIQVNAQEAIALSHYVFPAFTPGKVQQKNGTISDAKLNYNVLSGEMIFETAPGQYMALASPEQADTVFILDRKFIPVRNKFYELLTTRAYPLFVEYTCTVKEPGSDIGYGMSSVTTASPAIKALIQSGGAYSLKLPDGFQAVSSSQYWIFKDGKYQKANNAKQLVAVIPGKKEKINELIKKNNTSFSKRQDVIDLVQQL
ncbi:MAG: hypothetical protein NVSMB7_06970 [Chitinophagaceae bacterium]